MSHPVKKLLAILLAIWLPIFFGNAMAATLHCHPAGADSSMQCEHHHTPAQYDTSCEAACHLVCGGCLTAHEQNSPAVMQQESYDTAEASGFHSIGSRPPLHPPLHSA